MPDDEIIVGAKGWHVKFQPTFTLGTLLHLVMMIILLVGAWTRINDRLDSDQEQIKASESVESSLTTTIQQMQINLADDTTLISELESRITRDEVRPSR